MNVVDLGEPDRRRLPADPVGERAGVAEILQRLALGNARARERRDGRIGEMQPQPLALRRRQGRRLGAGDEGCKLADHAHGTISQSPRGLDTQRAFIA